MGLCRPVLSGLAACGCRAEVLVLEGEDVSGLIQEASSVLTNWRGVAGFSTLCGSVLTLTTDMKTGWTCDPHVSLTILQGHSYSLQGHSYSL